MSKKTTEEKQEVELTHVALGVAKGDDGWDLIKLKYNPLTKDAVVVEQIHAGPSRDFAIEKFKLTAVEEGLVG